MLFGKQASDSEITFLGSSFPIQLLKVGSLESANSAWMRSSLAPSRSALRIFAYFDLSLLVNLDVRPSLPSFLGLRDSRR